jgi:hypothetical protein
VLEQGVTEPAAELHGRLDTLFAGAGSVASRRNSQAMRLKAMQLLQRQPPAAQMPASQRHAERIAKATTTAVQLPSPHAQRSRAGEASGAFLQQQQQQQQQQPGAVRTGRPDSQQSNGSTQSQQGHRNPVTVRGRVQSAAGELARGL